DPAQPLRSAVMPIPIPEIAQRAEQVAPRLRSAERIVAGSEVEDIEAELPSAAEWIGGRLAGTAQTMASSPSQNGLLNLSDSWRVMRSKLAGWSVVLTRRATQLEHTLGELDTMRATWTVSREKAVDVHAPAAVIQRIDGTVAAIAAARSRVGGRLTDVLALQDRIVTEIGRCDEGLSRIAQARSALGGSPFARDSPPIWNPEARMLMSAGLGRRLWESVADIVVLTRDFLAGQLERSPLQVALFLIVLGLTRLARKSARQRVDKEPTEQTAARVF